MRPMAEWLESISVFPVVLTLAAFWLAKTCQKQWKSPALNPILIGAVLVIGFLLLTGMDPAVYKAGTAKLSWLMTPATVSLAIPMYEQMRVLKKNGKAIAVGAVAGVIGCMVTVTACAAVLGLEKELTIALLPKSVTTAIGVPLCELYGGIGSVTTAVIVASGVFANMLGTTFCKWFRITSPVAQGVAYGTAGHMIATVRAEELGQLEGAVSGVSLVIAGLVTAVIFPVFAGFIL